MIAGQETVSAILRNNSRCSVVTAETQQRRTIPLFTDQSWMCKQTDDGLIGLLKRKL